MDARKAGSDRTRLGAWVGLVSLCASLLVTAVPRMAAAADEPKAKEVPARAKPGGTAKGAAGQAQGAANARKQVRKLVHDALALMQKSKYADALPLLERALAKAPGSHKIWIHKGTCLFYEARPQEAIEAFDRALAIKKDAYSALAGKGLALFSLGQYKEAEPYFRAALEQKPKRPFGLLTSLGMAQLYSGSPDAALETFRHATELAPKKAQGFELTGIALFRLGKYDEAIAAFDRAIALDPLTDGALMSKASCLVKQGKPEEALATYDRALALNPLSAQALYNKGEVLRSLGRKDEARKAIEKAVSLQPNLPGAREALQALAPDPKAAKKR